MSSVRCTRLWQFHRQFGASCILRARLNKFASGLQSSPDWFAKVPLRGAVGAGLEHLGPGEREAIELAQQLGADRLLVDEAAGRAAAVERRIPVIGTLGILRNAAALGLIHLPHAIEKLRKTNFCAAPEIIRFLLEEDHKRREKS